MSLLSFPIDAKTVLVADASVAINLNATECALSIIQAQPGTLVITENALAELSIGRRNGHQDFDKFQSLISSNAVRVVQFGDVGTRVYASLVEGTALRTLDDGEAATIAYAHEAGAIALIDEKKAQHICASDFAHLKVMSTVDLLMQDSVSSILGQSTLAQALLHALRRARMRVPPHQIEKVIGIIGEEAAATCTSLPKAHRVAAL